MQVFFFIEQEVFTETHTTFVCIFHPKCQNQSTGHGFALKGVYISLAFSLLESLTIRFRGAWSQALDQL